MENLDRLFRDAKRIKPSEGMWDRIAARVQVDAKKGGAVKAGPAWGWRMAASFAIGLGALAAFLVFNQGTGRLAGKDGAGDFSGQPVASAASAQAGMEESIVDEDVLDWHADLGEAVDWNDDVLPVSFIEE